MFILITLSFLASLMAAEPYLPPGSYAAETYESLEISGIAKLNGTCVKDKLQVKGNLLTRSAEIGTLEVIGDANLTDTTIKQEGSILGSLQAVHSTFEKPITILSHRALFTASTLEGITVQADIGFKGKQVIELKQKTIVNGPIHFESGKGEVLLYPGSKVLGPITGGKLIKKK